MYLLWIKINILRREQDKHKSRQTNKHTERKRRRDRETKSVQVRRRWSVQLAGMVEIDSSRLSRHQPHHALHSAANWWTLWPAIVPHRASRHHYSVPVTPLSLTQSSPVFPLLPSTPSRDHSDQRDPSRWRHHRRRTFCHFLLDRHLARAISAVGVL